MNAHGTNSRMALVSLGLGALLACAGSGPALATGELKAARGGYELEVLVNGAPARTFHHEGETYVMGARGQQYTLRIHNRTGRRVEAVASIDGLDVVDGKPASVAKRGYLIPAWGSVEIDGWRLSVHEAATFRFSSVPQSYAASQGRTRNVGVIGVAIFPERVAPPPRPLYLPRSRSAPEPMYEGELGAAPADDDASFAEHSVPSGRDARGAGGPPAAASAPARPAEALRKSSAESHKAQRPGLGTEFGEAVQSQVYEVAFVRESATRPAVTLGLRYNDHAGLVAMGVPVDWPVHPYLSDAELRRTARPFPTSGGRFAAPPPRWSGR